MTASRPADSQPETRNGRRAFVLDTSVLLSDPGAIGRFGSHEVVIPLVVIGELEAKRHHPELGWFARQTLRALDDLRVVHGRLDSAVPIGDEGGELRVELNHSDLSTLPAGFRIESNDSRILAVALNLGRDGHDVTLVTQGPAAAGQGRLGGPACGRVPRRRHRRQRLDRHGRTRGAGRDRRRAVRRRAGRDDRIRRTGPGGRTAVPHRAGAALARADRRCRG